MAVPNTTSSFQRKSPSDIDDDVNTLALVLREERTAGSAYTGPRLGEYPRRERLKQCQR